MTPVALQVAMVYKMSRNTAIRKHVSDTAAMEYPYAFTNELNAYGVKDILRPIPVETGQADAGDFPKNIHEHFWISEGERDGRPWHSIGLLKNGNYFYYTASCDYTGFDCQGEMRLYVSASYANIIKHALSDEVYRQYLKETS